MKESKAFFPQKVIPTQVSLSGKMSRPVNTNNPLSSYSNHKQHVQKTAVVFAKYNKCKGGFTTSARVFAKVLSHRPRCLNLKRPKLKSVIFLPTLIQIFNKILHILHMHKLSLFSGKQLWIICHIHHSSEEVGKKDEINKNGGDYFFAVQLFHKWPNLGDRAAEQRAKKPIRKFLQ